MAQNYDCLSSAINEMKRFDKYDMPRWESARLNAIRTLNECAQYLDKVSSGTSVAKITGGGVSILGGAVCIVGLLTLNPFVFGSGTAICTGGSITSVTSSLIKLGWTRSKQKEAENAMKLDKDLYQKYEKIDKNLRNQIKKCKSMIKSRSLSTTVSTTLSTLSAIKTARTTVNVIHGIGNSIDKMNLVAIGAIPAEFADDVARELIYSPNFKLAKLIGADAFAVSQVFAAGGIFLSLGFGLWDIINGAKEIDNGNDVSKKMRKTAQDLRKNLEDIKKIHKATMNAIN